MKTSIEEIQESLKTILELERLYDSDNIVLIGQHCNRLSILSVGIGKQVSDADKLFNQLKDQYEHAVEEKKIALIEAGAGVGRAESEAKIAMTEKKKDYRKEEDNYERMKRFLSRIDKVLDAYKQYTATLKMGNLKGI